MKRIPLKIRYTIITSLFLLGSCVALMIFSNISADRMMRNIEEEILAEAVVPAQNGEILEEKMNNEVATPAVAKRASYVLFRTETAMATGIIVLFGSVLTYFAAGYLLKPIQKLSMEIKKRNSSNFAQPLVVPQSADEIQELTVSFNQLLAEVQHSFQIQKQFSADAAHELHTPLAILQTKIDVFSMDKTFDNQTQEFMNTLQKQVERLTILIDDLLLFSRDLPLENMELVQLQPLLIDVIDELIEVADDKNIKIELQCSNETVYGQDHLLERVFYNLLENAIKYSSNDTKISISVKQENEKTIVVVEDQGEGIPAEFQKDIFEPFFRIDKSRSRSVGGNGLGLAVCNKILNRHNAKISVRPNIPKGSIFQVVFPS